MEETVHRIPSPLAAVPPAPETPTGRGRRLALAGGAAVLVVVAVGVVVALSLGGPSDRHLAATGRHGAATENGPASTVPPLVADPDPPSDVRVTVQGTAARVTWNAPGALPGDRYRVIRVDPGHTSSSYLQVGSHSATIRGIGTGTTPCFEVLTVRSDQISDPSSPGCAAS